jgi:hypothetical protein
MSLTGRCTSGCSPKFLSTSTSALAWVRFRAADKPRLSYLIPKPSGSEQAGRSGVPRARMNQPARPYCRFGLALISSPMTGVIYLSVEGARLPLFGAAQNKLPNRRVATIGWG